MIISLFELLYNKNIYYLLFTYLPPLFLWVGFGIVYLYNSRKQLAHFIEVVTVTFGLEQLVRKNLLRAISQHPLSPGILIFVRDDSAVQREDTANGP